MDVARGAGTDIGMRNQQRRQSILRGTPTRLWISQPRICRRIRTALVLRRTLVILGFVRGGSEQLQTGGPGEVPEVPIARDERCGLVQAVLRDERICDPRLAALLED